MDEEVGVLLGERTGRGGLVPGDEPRRRALRVAGEQLALREVQELDRLRFTQQPARERDAGRDAHLSQRPAQTVGDLEQARRTVALGREALEVSLRQGRVEDAQHRVLAEEERGPEPFGFVLEPRVLEHERVDGDRRAPDLIAARRGLREAGLGLADRGLLRRHREGTGHELEVHRVRIEERVDDLDPVRARDLGHAHRVDARVGIAYVRGLGAVAPQIGILRRIGEEMHQTTLDTEGGLEMAPTDQGQNAIPASRQALEEIREPDAANVTLEGHYGVVELSALGGGRVEDQPS